MIRLRRLLLDGIGNLRSGESRQPAVYAYATRTARLRASLSDRDPDVNVSTALWHQEAAVNGKRGYRRLVSALPRLKLADSGPAAFG